MRADDHIRVSQDTRRQLKMLKARKDARSYDEVLRSLLDSHDEDEHEEVFL